MTRLAAGVAMALLAASIDPLAQGTAPGGVTGAALWVKADGGLTLEGATQQVREWADQSGGTNVASQLRAALPAHTSAITPSAAITRVASAINFNPAVDFTGASGRSLKGNANTEWDATPISIFAVSVADGPMPGGSIGGIFDGLANWTTDPNAAGIGLSVNTAGTAYLLDGNGANTGPTTSPINQPRVVRGIYTNPANQLGGSTWLDGVQEGTGTSNATTALGLFEVGGRTAGATTFDPRVFNGKIAEVIVYKSVLSAADANDVESYLALKYGITLRQTPAPKNYTDSTSAIIWDATANATHKRHIAGIGRDDDSGLVQRQSKSINAGEIVTIGLGEIAVENATNPNNFATDRTFLIWGRDAGDPNLTNILTGTGLIRVQANWRVQETGEVGDVVVRVPANILPGTSPVLVQSADATFDQADTQVTLNLNAGSLETAAIDLDNGQYFTFAAIPPPAPGGVAASMALWLKANTGVTPVAGAASAWADQSGLGRNASQATAANRPTIVPVSVNFNPGLDFDGSADFMDIVGNVGFSASNPLSFFGAGVRQGSGSWDPFLAQPGSNPNDGVFGWGPGLAVAIGSTAGTVGVGSAAGTGSHSIDVPRLASVARGNGDVDAFDFYTDGAATGTSTTNLIFGADPNTRVGGRTTGTDIFNGVMTEVIAYTRTLSPLELQRVHSYLAIKYGITMPQTTPLDYLGSDASVIWSAAANAGYKNNIAGIGLDNGSVLNQKQSRSINTGNSGDLVTIGLGSIETSNELNLNAFAADRTFLTWGDDNAGLVQSLPVAGLPGVFRVRRVWKAQETNDSGTVLVRIPASTLVGTLPVLIVSNDPTFATGNTTVPLLPSGANLQATTTFGNAAPYFTFASVLPAAPGGVASGLVAWQKANDGISTSALWQDSSLANNDAAQGTAGSQPILRAGSAAEGVNFNPTFDFDGTNDFFQYTSTLGIAGTADFSSAVVFRPDVLGVVHALFGDDSAGSNQYDFGLGTTGAMSTFVGGGVGVCTTTTTTTSGANFAAIGSAVRGASSMTTRLNGGGAATGPCAANFAPDTRRIGARNANFSNGAIPELIHYDRTLTANELQRVQSYLAVKYGVALDETTPLDYLASDGSVIWNATANSAYNSGITGIGRDDGSALDQRQSKHSTPAATLTIGHSTIAVDNLANTTGAFSTDKSFMLWGQDGGSLSQLVLVPSTTFTRLTRVWKVQETGTVGPVVVRIRATILAGRTPSLIHSQSATFASGNTIVPMTLVGENYEAATNFADGDFFTFASVMSNPGGVDGESLWLRSDLGQSCATEGCAVTQWVDQSGNAKHASVSGGTLSRANAGVNFNPTLAFDANEKMTGPSLLGTATFTDGNVWIVSKKIAVPAGGSDADFYEVNGQGNGQGGLGIIQPWGDNLTYWDAGDNTNGGARRLIAPAGTIPLGVYELKTYNASTTANQTIATPANTRQAILKNGKVILSDTTMASYPGTNNLYNVGGYATVASQSEEIAEIIVRTGPVTAAEQQRIHGYLALKYGITLDQTVPTSYLASDGTTMWASANAPYNNNIAGIGRDDTSALLQKQSRSINTANSGDLVTIGLDPIAADNASNSGVFTADKQFVAWGDNGLSTFLLPTVTGGPAGLKRMSRVWKVQETGTPNNVQVRIPVSALPGSGAVLIRSLDPTFATGNTFLPLVPNGGNYEVTTNFDNNEFFTFGALPPTAPGGIAGGLALWLRADSPDSPANGANFVNGTGWLDQSGNTRHANAVTSDPQKVGGVVNFNPAVRFDGNDWMRFGTSPFVNAFTAGEVFSVVKDATPTSGNEGNPYDFGGGYNSHYTWSNQAIYNEFGTTTRLAWVPTTKAIVEAKAGVASITGPGVNTGLFHIYATRSGPGDWGVSFDGFNAATTTSHTVSFGLVAGNELIGGSDGATAGAPIPFNGDLPEIFLYNRVLSATERQLVNSYLAVKYGITQLTPAAGAQDYVSTQSVVTWNGVANATFHTDVAGIGRDDATALLQKQSASINAGNLLTIGRGVIAADNQANPTTPDADQSFFIWGRNTAATTQNVAIATTDVSRIARVWRGQETGEVGPVVVRVPATLLTGTQPALIRSADATIDAGDTFVPMARVGANYEVTFDFPTGEQFFTFGSVLSRPGGVGGEALWLRGDLGMNCTADGCAVTAWDDQSGSGRNATTTVGTLSRKNIGVNFNPALGFEDGDGMRGSSLLGASTVSNANVYIVSKKVSTGTTTDLVEYFNAAGTLHLAVHQPFVDNIAYWDAGSADANGRLTAPVGTIAMGQYELKSYNASTTPGQTFAGAIRQGISKNGKLITNDSTLVAFTGNNSPYQLGGISQLSTGGANTPDGAEEFAEVIVYTTPITAAQQQAIESYLAIKYGITLDQTTARNYVDSGAAPIWTAATNGVYKNGIAGIGRDDVSALNQKQSKSIHAGEFVTIGLGPIAIDNASNASVFAADRNFLMWGHDNASSIWNPSLAVGTTGLSRMPRVWKVEETGATIATVVVRIPTTILGGVAPTLIRSAGDAIFDNSDTLVPLTLNNGFLEASIDFATGDFFTFASQNGPVVKNFGDGYLTDGTIKGAVPGIIADTCYPTEFWEHVPIEQRGVFTGGNGGFMHAGLTANESTVLADVNNDGKLDILSVFDGAGTPAANGTYVWLGNGDGTFQTAAIRDTGNNWIGGTGGISPNESMHVGDVNGDGSVDIVLLYDGGASAATDGTWTWLGNGDGTFSHTAIIEPAMTGGPGFAFFPAGGYSASESTDLVDVNNDGRLDIVWVYDAGATSNQSGTRVWLGEGDGTWQTTPTTSLGLAGGAGFAFSPAGGVTPNESTHLVDVDNDGIVDLVWLWDGNLTASSGVRWWKGTGTGTFAVTPTVQTGFAGGPGIAFGAQGGQTGNEMTRVVDVNRDGNLDIVWIWDAGANVTQSGTYVYLGTGGGAFNPTPVRDIGTFSNAPMLGAAYIQAGYSPNESSMMGDLNGDEVPDILWASELNGVANSGTLVWLGKDTDKDNLADIVDTDDDNDGIPDGPDTCDAPGSIDASMQLWLKADEGLTVDGTNNAIHWKDQTLANRDANLIFGDPLKVEAGVNFNPTVAFDGGDYFRFGKSTFVTGFTAAEVFAVTRTTQAAGSTNGHPFDFGSSIAPGGLTYTWSDNAIYNHFGTTDRLGFNPLTQAIVAADPKAGVASITGPPIEVRNYHLYSTHSATGDWGIRFDGNVTAQTATNTTSFALSGFNEAVAAGNGGIFTGEVAEVILYNRTLTESERFQVESYLGTKYGITIGHNYLASDDTTIYWDMTANAAYHNDVAGIGRDDLATLSQKQSGSINPGNIVFMSLGAFQATNQLNTSIFDADRTFMLWGHNNGLAGPAVLVPGTDPKLTRFGRAWKVQETLAVGVVTVRVPASALAGTAATLIRSTNDTFDSADQFLPMTLNGTDYEVTIDFASGDFFTFGAFNPAPGGVAANLGLWVKANDGPSAVIDGANVSLWEDRSGRAKDLSVLQPAAAVQPTFTSASLNFNPAVTLLNTTTSDQGLWNQDFLGTVNGSYNIDASMFFAHTPRKAANCNGLADFSSPIDAGSSDHPWMGSCVPAPYNGQLAMTWSAIGVRQSGPSMTTTNNTPYLHGYTWRYNIAGSLSFRQNGTVSTDAAFAPSHAGRDFYLLRDSNDNLNDGSDEMNEAIMYSRQLTAVENQRVESYLAIKYGVTLKSPSNGPQDYLNAAEVVTWNGVANPTYHNNVAGIMADGASALDQRVSQSVNAGAQIAIAAGAFDFSAATIAAQSPSTIVGDESSVVWGDNNGSTVINIAVADANAQAAGIEVRMARIWRDQLTGTGVPGELSIRVPATMIETGNPTLRIPSLLISTDPTFASNTRVVPLAPIAGFYVATFTTFAAGATPESYFTLGGATSAVNLSKAFAPVPLAIGGRTRLTLTLANASPVTQSGLTFTDTLPSGLIVATPANEITSCAPGTVSASGSIISLTNGEVAAAQTCTVEVDVTTAPSVTAPITCPAAAITNGSGNITGLSSNLSLASGFGACVSVVLSSDVSIVKAAPASFVAGSTVAYTLTVTNNGPSPASDVVVTDVLPAQLTFVAAGSTPSCSAAVQTVTCTLGTLTSGQIVPITLNVEVAASLPSGATASNTASVTTTTPDPDSSNNSSTVISPQSTGSADLRIVKSTLGASVTPGNTFTYHLEVTNDGPSAASNVTAADTLPSPLTFVSSSTCSGAGQAVSCGPVPTLAPGATQVFEFVVRLHPGYTGSGTEPEIANVATTTSDTPDPDTANNTSNSVQPPTVNAPSADLVMDKIAVEPSVAPGATFTYRLTITNNGPSTAVDVGATDTLAAGLTFVSSSTCTAIGQDVTCGPVASLDPQASTTFDIVVRLDAAYAGDSDDITNTATATSPTADPDAANDSDTANLPTVTPQADLQIVKSLNDPTGIAPGESYAYTLAVLNNGPSVAHVVTVTDVLPPYVILDPVTPLPAQCSFTPAATPVVPGGGGTVTCVSTIDPMPAGTGDTFIIPVQLHADYATSPGPQDGTDQVNTAHVGPTTTDPALQNNDSPLGAPPVGAAQADIAIVKTANAPAPVAPGQTFTYTLLVSNQGPSNADAVVATDVLPLDIELLAPLPAGCSYDSGTRTVTCTVATDPMAPGASQSFVLPVRLNPAFDTTLGCAAIGNTATAAAATATDPIPANNTTPSPVCPPLAGNEADVEITKSTSASPSTPVVPGTTFTYTLTVRNLGPSDAKGVAVTDVLPAPLTFLSSTPAGCTAVGQTVTCPTIPTLAFGATTTFDLLVRLDPSYLGSGVDVVNTGSVDTTSNDANATNDTSNASSPTVAAPSADVLLTKSITNPTVVPGQTLEYSIAVTNAGPSTARDVTISDALPAGLSFVSASAGCSHAAGTVTCGPVATLAPSGGANFTVTVRLDPAYTGDGSDLGNVATAAGTTPDPDLTNNSNVPVTPTVVAASADVSITKTTVDASVVPGLTFSYTIAVSNAGPSVATNVVVTDTLPAGLSFVSSSIGCSAAGQLVTCPPIASIAVGGSSALTLTVALDPAYLGDGSDLGNVAEVTPGSADPDLTNNKSTTAAAPAILAPSADVRIVKSVSDTLVQPGETFTYTLTITNAGPSVARDVFATDTLPLQVSFDSSPDGCGATGRDVVCPAISVLGVGQSATFTFVVQLDPSYIAPVGGPGSDILNSSLVSASTTDPAMANNSSPAGAPPVGPGKVDLAIRKDVSTTPVTPGDEFTYTLTVSNQGPSTATGIVVTDVLPSANGGVHFVSSPDGCTNGGSDQTVTCTIASLAPGGSATLTIVATLDSNYGVSGPGDGSDIPNTASVTGDQDDPVPANNTSNPATPIIGAASADVSVDKTMVEAQALPGEEFTYRITVTNTGPSTALGVTVLDVLPAQVSFVSSPHGCAAGGQHTVGCPPIGSLAVGATVVYDLRVRLDSAYTGDGSDVINTARVAATTADPDPADNEDTVAIADVGAGNSNIAITKSVVTTPIVPGAPLTYRLTISNAGPAMATNIAVTDTLPSQVAFVSSTGGCTNGGSGQLFTCTPIATLAAGANTSIDIVVTLAENYTGNGSDVMNTATAVPTTADPDTTDNTVTVPLPTVGAPQADLVIAKAALEASVQPGGTFTYRIGVRNDGPSTATGIVVTDTLPLPLTFVSSVASGCTVAVSTVTCTHPSLAVGTTGFFEFVVRLDAGYTGNGSDLGNIASVSATTVDPDLSDNTSAVAPPPTIAPATAELTITKTANEPSVTPGETFSYDIVVSNSGPSTATDIVVTDTLPAGLTFVSSTAGCTAAGQLVTCPAIASMTPGSSSTVTLVVRLDPAYVGDGSDLANTATATSPTDPTGPTSPPALPPTINPARADVRIVKSVSTAAVSPGQPFTYTMTVTNAGPSNAVNVVVTDTLPSQVAFLVSTENCTAVGQSVTCPAIASLGVGASATFTVDVVLDPSYSGTGADILNSSIVAADTADPAMANNTSPAGAPPTGPGFADLAIRKDVSTTPVVPGDTFTYTLTVSNQGPSTAAGVVVTDALPVGVNFVSSPELCTNGGSGQVVTCPTIATMVPGASATFTLVVQLDSNYGVSGPNDGSDIPNTATVASATSDPVPANNTSNPATPIVGTPSADLSVVKSVLESTVTPGGTFTYRIVVTNNGPSTALSVQVADTLPSQVTFVSSPSSCNATSQVLTCPPVGSLAVGATATFDVIVRLDPAYTGSGTDVLNTATVTSPITDPDPTDNTTPPVQPPSVTPASADVSITKAVLEPVVLPGQPFTYRLTVTNAGPSTAVNVTVTDVLPAAVTFVSSVDGCTAVGVVVTCPPIAAFLPGATATIDLVVQLDPSYLGTGADQVNVAHVVTPTSDPVAPNNISNPVTVTVGSPSADLVIAKEALEPSVTPGESFTYRIGIRNDGPSTAVNVGATDTLPAPLGFASSALGACSASGQTVTCGPVASLAPGQTAFFEFVVRLDAAYTGDGSDLGNVATATSTTPDPNPGNDINPPAPPPAVNPPSADVAIFKSVTAGPVAPGEVFDYTLMVGSIGPSVATNVVVTDTLPPQVTFVSSPDGCTAVGRSVTCPTIPSLPPFIAPQVFTITVQVDPAYEAPPSGAGSDILNTAIVLADTADPAMANNSSRLGAAPVGPGKADLAIVKDVSADPVTPGTDVTYQIIATNQGPSVAHDVTVTDTLPVGLTPVSAVALGADCTVAGQLVTCVAFGDVPVGSAVIVSLTAHLAEGYAGNGSDLGNIATVSTSDADPVPANNTSDPATPIIGAANADVSIAKTVLEPNVVPGGTFTYRLVVSNAGPSTALGVVVTDPLPAAVAFVSSPQGCTATGQTVTCPPIGSLAVGASRTFDIVVRLDENYAGTGSDIVNIASVTSSTTDPNPGNETTPPVTAPPVTPTGVDIAVTIASTASATVTGDVVTFTVTVTNNGPDDATGVVVSVPLPGELSLEAATGPGNYDPTTGAWTIGALAKGATVSAQLQVRALSAASLVISATKTALDQVERNPLNDAASIGLNLTGWSTFFTDLVLEGKTAPPVVAAGAVLGFELQAINRGPTYVVDLYIEGDVPAGTTFVNVSPSTGAVCTAPAPGGTGKVSCKWPGATFVDPGAKRAMTLNVRVDPSAAPGSSISGTFLVSSLNQEYYDASNHLTLVSSVSSGTMTDLALTAVMRSEGVTGTALAVPVGVGTPMRFTVRNAGSAMSAGARYSIEIPPSDILGIQVMGLNLSQGAVGLTGISSAEWQVGPLAPGASATFDLTLAMHSMRATTVAMRRLESAPGDPNSDNDRATLILDGSGHPEGGERYAAIGNVDGVGPREIVTGAGRLETPQVRIYTGAGADTGLHFYAYDRNFVGGVRVATCDVDGDGTDEIVTGPGIGPGPHVRVLRLQGQVMREVVGFYAFSPTFFGGVYVACADIDNDHRADVIVGQGQGGSEVRVFTVGPNLVTQKAAFTAYEASFTGGVRVAAISTIEASGTQYQVVTAPGPGRALEVRAWALAGSSATMARALAITGPEFQLGAFLDVADINADGRAEVVLATDRGIPALVGALTIDSGQFLGIFQPYPSSFLGGAHVALGDIDSNGQMELLLSPGVGGRPIVDAFTVSGGAAFRFRVTPIEVP